VSEVSK